MHKSILNIYQPGILKVISGCMKSGKTDELLREFNITDYSVIPYILFQPITNSRDQGDFITSRSGLQLPVTKIENPYDILDKVNDTYLKIGLDEAQFFDKRIEEVVNELLLQDKYVIISGLDTDSNKQPFGSMDYFLREADIVEKVHAICESCKERPAKYSFYEGDKEQQIVIGDSTYSALCRPCFHNHS